MDEGLSIGTDVPRNPDIALPASSDADGSVFIDVKHLSVESENVARFREQLNTKSQSTETENVAIAEGEAKHDISEGPVSKHSAPNERKLFGNNGKHTPPFVSGESPYSSKNENTDGFRKDFHEKSMKFDISSKSSALKTGGGTVMNNVTHEEYVAYKSPFFGASEPSRTSVNSPKDFRNTFTNTETLPTDTPLRNTSSGNKTNFPAGVLQSNPDLPQTSPKLKSPAMLLRELQTPTASTKIRTSEATTTRIPTAPNAANIPVGNVVHKVPVFREPKNFKTLSVPTNFSTDQKEISSATLTGTSANTSKLSFGTSVSISAQASATIAKEPAAGALSTETLHTPENRTIPHSTTSSMFNATPSLTDAFAKGGTAALTTSQNRTAPANMPETKPISTRYNTASTSQPFTEIETREHPRSPESTSEPHGTAVIDTIPFLRTANGTVAPVEDPTTAQQTQKSHATLIAQQIRDHIIDRILVSSSTLNAKRTVTIQLSPRLLQDTEVQFTQNGTSLDIRLTSQNKDSVQFLQQHQSDLQTYLQGELKTYRTISVRVPPSQTTSELSQPHDGRSRNRFGYQSADEEEPV